VNPITVIHREAMEYADQAFVARLNREFEKAREFSRKAFELERKAAEQLTDQTEAEPSRSVLLRSAATLALDCGEYAEAERLVYLGLSGNPPTAIRQELQEVFERSVVLRLEAKGEVVRLEPEVVEAFGSSEAVKTALRKLLEIVPKKAS
jgi:hypothetical protein